MEKIKKKIDVVDFIANYRILLMIGGLMVGSAIMWLNINFAGSKELDESISLIEAKLEENSKRINAIDTQIKLIRKDLQYFERIFADNTNTPEDLELPSNQSK